MVGQTIVDVRAMTAEEADAEDWSHESPEHIAVIVLSDGSKLYGSRDYEGNGPGAIFGATSEGQTFAVIPPGSVWIVDHPVESEVRG